MIRITRRIALWALATIDTALLVVVLPVVGWWAKAPNRRIYAVYKAAPNGQKPFFRNVPPPPRWAAETPPVSWQVQWAVESIQQKVVRWHRALMDGDHD